MSSPERSDLLPEAPPEAWEPLLRLARFARRPLERFLQIEAASGILLLLTAAVALVWANSPWADSYAHFWHTPVSVGVGGWHFERSLEWVVNDGLMVIFFFVVGLEIRRELHHGELSEWRRAAVPAAAALGGMVAPALIYTLIAGEGPSRPGWGVPQATDIAFAVGILALLGRRVPAALRVLLLALAVIDDLGAIVVIAIFYSAGVDLQALGAAAIGLGAIFLMQWAGVRQKLAYLLPGLVIWAGVYASGVHPTIAGVVIGLVTPVRAWLGTDGFLLGVRNQLDGLAAGLHGSSLSEALRQVDLARREATSPAESLIEALHPWVAFGIMPLFALANSGVSISSEGLDGAASLAAVGAGVGLLLGKPIGVLLACFLMLKSGLGTLPIGLGWRHLLVLGVVAGVGFTMALFVAQLAFDEPGMLNAAKIGVLAGSAVSAVLGLVLGRVLMPDKVESGAAESADEAEASTLR